MIAPIKTRTLEIVEYWACNVSHHRHRDRGLAAECMQKHKGRSDLKSKELKIASDFSCVEDLRLFLEVGSFTKIATIKGKSSTRIKQKTAKAVRILYRSDATLPLREYHTKKWMLSNKDKLLDKIEMWILNKIDLSEIQLRDKK